MKQEDHIKLKQIERELRNSSHLLFNYYLKIIGEIDFEKSIIEIIDDIKTWYEMDTKEEVYRRLRSTDVIQFAMTLDIDIYRNIDDIVDYINNKYEEFLLEQEAIAITNNYLAYYLNKNFLF